MTEVLNLATRDRITYSCRPEQAVVSAYRQSMKDWNTWSYDWSLVQLGPSGRTVFCGDFAAILPGRWQHQMTIFE